MLPHTQVSVTIVWPWLRESEPVNGMTLWNLRYCWNTAIQRLTQFTLALDRKYLSYSFGHVSFYHYMYTYLSSLWMVCSEQPFPLLQTREREELRCIIYSVIHLPVSLAPHRYRQRDSGRCIKVLFQLGPDWYVETLTFVCYQFMHPSPSYSLSPFPPLQAPWTLTFWLVFEEIRVLAGVGNF